MSNPYEFHEDVLRAGRKGQLRDDIQDFSVDPIDGMVRVRKFFVQDWGDAPDVGFGRMGPDNAPWPPNEGAPDEVAIGTNLGTWYWRAWERARGWTRRQAQIYCRLGSDGSGSLHFATAQPGGTTNDDAMRDRLILGPDGVFHFENVDTRAGQAGEIQMRCTVNGMAGWLVFREGP